MNALLDQAKKTQLPDQTKAPAQHEFEIPAVGKTMARFIGYVEVGKRPQSFNGKEKNPVREARLFFELNGAKHRKVIKVEEDGKEVERTVTNRVFTTLPIMTTDKANFAKLFRAMRNGRDSITHMAQMLGEAFLITIVHNEVGEGDKKKVYANFKNDNGWLIEPPAVTDPISGETVNVPVPEPIQPLMLLLWDSPTKEQWDSIFIDGTRTVKDDKGVETEVSRNWMQEDIIKNALDFEGSALNDLLHGLGELTLAPDEPEPAQTSQGGASKPADPEPTTTKAEAAKPASEPAVKPAAAEPAVAKSADEILAGLGL